MSKHDAHTRNQESVGTHVTRRTVTRGIAWTAPVVAVAAAAPAFAASRCELVLDLDPAKSCKDAKDAKYFLVFRVVNSCTGLVDCTATITKVTESTGPRGQERTLFAGSVTTPDGVVICNANNLAANVLVTASISCANGTSVASKVYTVKTSQFNSTNFCNAGTFNGCTATTTTTTTVA